MFMSMNQEQLEHELRVGSQDARQRPSRQLRPRTMSALQRPSGIAAPRDRVRPVGGAVFAGIAAMVALAIVAASFDRPAIQTDVVQNVEPAVSAMHVRLAIPDLPRLSGAQVQETIALPLKREAILIARDAERMFDRLRSEVQKLPRLEIPERREPAEPGESSAG